MTERERDFLLEKFRAFQAKQKGKKVDFYSNPCIARIDPFRIADNLYYVGDKKVCIHLIDSGDGLILLDSGYLGTTHLLIDSIWRAGFDPRDVRWILHSHAHSDHFGASDEFSKMFGTKLALSKADADAIRERPERAHISPKSYPYAKMPVFDRELEDGEIFELGNVKIRCVLTPGHTQGVLSFFFDVTDNGKTYLAGMFGGAGVNALTLPYICYNQDPENCPQQMLESIDKIWNENVVVHLGNHPYNSRTLQKREQQLKEGGNPFIAPESWHNFLTELKESVEEKIKENDALKLEMQNL